MLKKENNGSRWVIAAGIFLVFTAVLSVYVLYDFRSDTEYDASKSYFLTTEMNTSLENLCAALEKDDIVMSYHYAKDASFFASMCGKTDEAKYFSEIAEAIIEGKAENAELDEMIRTYLKSETIKAISFDESEMKDMAVIKLDESGLSRLKEESAKKTAEGILGVEGVLYLSAHSNKDEYVYACRNAYVVIDGESGKPLEMCISGTRGERKLSESECIVKSRAFIEQFKGGFTDYAVASVKYDDMTNIYKIKYTGKNLIETAVNESSGKIVRFISR